LSKFPERVIPFCQQAWNMAKRVGDIEVVADARNTLAFQKEDPKEGITILEDLVELTEAEGLLRAAARAHINLGVFLDEYLIDMNLARQHPLRALEIYQKIGDLEGFTIPYNNAFEVTIYLGQLKTAEQMFNEFFSDATRPVFRKEYFRQLERVRLQQAKGEWKSALELNQILRTELRQGDLFRSIALRNIGSASLILELTRFGMDADLSEAENALMENLEIGQLRLEAYFTLVAIYARQGQLSAAWDQFHHSLDEIPPTSRDNNLFTVNYAIAEFELALAEERWPEAVEASNAAIEGYRNCGHRWGWARRLIDLSDALAGRNETGDLERARETYQKSLDMFTEMGAPGYIQVLEERLEGILGTKSTSKP
jgi:tetratricopeptide (TPR) repeat protein